MESGSGDWKSQAGTKGLRLAKECYGEIEAEAVCLRLGERCSPDADDKADRAGDRCVDTAGRDSGD
ncbi:hypothetical protein AX768_02425 [Burkholderia sp. PAMC 28687]|nr:hypothetical protein AX768_02425 [Burkholderia sp. PAMC 28687]